MNETDIASDEIERVINPYTTLFQNIKKFTVVDESKYRGIFGVFLGLLKNMHNVEELHLITDDRNMCTLFGEFLPRMTRLKKLYWSGDYNPVWCFKAIESKCFNTNQNATLTEVFVNKAHTEAAQEIIRMVSVKELVLTSM
jgi:hypothetical protein